MVGTVDTPANVEKEWIRKIAPSGKMITLLLWQDQGNLAGHLRAVWNGFRFYWISSARHSSQVLGKKSEVVIETALYHGGFGLTFGFGYKKVYE
jgi:hypothetical protein